MLPIWRYSTFPLLVLQIFNLFSNLDNLPNCPLYNRVGSRPCISRDWCATMANTDMAFDFSFYIYVC